MIHLAVAMTLLVLTHILCLAAMTERKYSIRKTVLIYAAFAAYFIGLTMAAFALFGSLPVNIVAIIFAATILAAFLLFLLTSTDTFCKKLFLFISYSNLFCIFVCISLLTYNRLLSVLTETGALYARNIVRTLLYLPAVLVYIKFLRPCVRAVPGTKKADMVFHFSGFGAVFRNLCVFSHIFLCWPRLQRRNELSLCDRCTDLLLRTVGHLWDNPVYGL